MSYRLLVRAAAERDLNRARDWYLAEAPHVLGRFEAELDAAFQGVLDSPLRFRRVVCDARRAHLKVFPYEVWYRVHPQRQVIEVVAVVHDRQDLARFEGRVG